MRFLPRKRFWPISSREDLAYEALSLTFVKHATLTGRWTVVEQTSSGPVLSSAWLQQHGAAITGELQCKFAALAPIEISGIVVRDRLIATWYRPDVHGKGSGTLELRATSDGARLDGNGSWFTASSAQPEQHSLHWERIITTNPYDPPQEEPEPREKSAWQYLYDPLIDRWVWTILFAIAVIGAIVSTLSTICLSR
jgi:hypothetical protein